MDVRVGPPSRLNTEELILSNCGAGEEPWKPLESKEIQAVHPKGNQSWIFIGRTDAETSILWPPDAKNWFTGKDSDAGKDWRREEKGVTEDEMVGWHHWLNGHEFEHTSGDNEGQGSLECCNPWGRKVLDTTEQLNNNPSNSLGAIPIKAFTLVGYIINNKYQWIWFWKTLNKWAWDTKQLQKFNN